MKRRPRITAPVRLAVAPTVAPIAVEIVTEEPHLDNMLICGSCCAHQRLPQTQSCFRKQESHGQILWLISKHRQEVMGLVLPPAGWFLVPFFFGREYNPLLVSSNQFKFLHLEL